MKTILRIINNILTASSNPVITPKQATTTDQTPLAVIGQGDNERMILPE